MQEISRREVLEGLTRGKEAGAGERMEEGEEFRLCSAGPMDQSGHTALTTTGGEFVHRYVTDIKKSMSTSHNI